MKKALVTICLIVVFFILFFLQANFFQTFTIGGIMPNLIVIFILVIGLSANVAMGLSFGVFCGLVIDLVYGKTIGITAVMLCVVGYLGAYFDKNFSKENKLTIIIMVAVATAIFEIGQYIINSVILNFDPEILYFVEKLVVEMLYNVLLAIIFYPLIQKAGYSMDRTFKQKNVLTRYF